MESSTVRLETRWTLHLGSVGGEDYLFLPLVHISSYNVQVVTVSGRICPGKYLAHSTLTLAAASVLSTFDLVREVDKNGRDIEPKKEYTGSALR